MAYETTQVLILKLIKENYDNWCIHMRGLLGFQDVLDIMEDSFKDVLSKEVKVSLSDDKKKQSYIMIKELIRWIWW